MTNEGRKKLVLKKHKKDNYVYGLKNCPKYEGYVPENLTHEVCKYCGNIKYYH